MAELAELFPLHSGLWRRLGRVSAQGVEVELEGWELRVRIAGDRKEIHVLQVTRAARPEQRERPRSEAVEAPPARPTRSARVSAGP